MLIEPEGVVMEVIVERPAALDVHKAQVTACVRVPGADGGRVEQVQEFKTTVAGLLVLADWLKAHRVSQVTMEATGVYWKPVWHVLEDDFELLLVNARHVKQVPGRKTDVADAQWLCRLAEAGLLRSSFVPPKPIRELRQLTRYHKTQIAERQREANRLHKALEDTGIKLDCVATDILGVSGRAMLDALVQGTTDPEILAHGSTAWWQTAGFSGPASFHEMTSREWHELLDVSLYGAFYTLREGVRHIVERGQAGDPGRSLVGRGSGTNFLGVPRTGHDGAPEGDLLAMIWGISVEYGRYGIRANLVAPGYFDAGIARDPEVVRARAQEMQRAQPDPATARAGGPRGAHRLPDERRILLPHRRCHRIDGGKLASFWPH